MTRHAEAGRALRPRIDGLRALLAEAWLLDPPDHGERVDALEVEHRSAMAAQLELSRSARFAAIVDDNVAILRSRPLSDDALASLRRRVEALRHDRDRLDAAVDALEYVRSNTEALGWSEAPARLAGHQALVPALEAQLREAEAAQEGAEQVARDADTHYDEVTSDWQDADGVRRVAIQQHAAAVTRFEAIGISAPTEDALRAAGADVERIEGELRAQNGRRDELFTARGSQENACREARERAMQADEKLASERREAEPAVARWERLRERAMQHGVLASVLAPGPTDLSGVRGHVNLVQEARTRREILHRAPSRRPGGRDAARGAGGLAGHVRCRLRRCLPRALAHRT